MTQEQQDQEARDELLSKLTKLLREILDDEKKRLKANLELRYKQKLESQRRDHEAI
jgi:hypothetical protein